MATGLYEGPPSWHTELTLAGQLKGSRSLTSLLPIRTSGFFPLILNSLILYLRARCFNSLTHTQFDPNPGVFSLHHRSGQPLSQGACNSASSPQRGERRAASVQSCAPVGPWPAVQESSTSARLSPRRARHFHSYSHAPRAAHIHSPATCYSLTHTHTHTHAPRHAQAHATRHSLRHARTHIRYPRPATQVEDL